MSLNNNDLLFLQKVREGSVGRKWASNNVQWNPEDHSTFRKLINLGFVSGPVDTSSRIQAQLTADGREILKANRFKARAFRWLGNRATNAIDVGLSHLVVLIIGVLVGLWMPSLVGQDAQVETPSIQPE